MESNTGFVFSHFRAELKTCPTKAPRAAPGRAVGTWRPWHSALGPLERGAPGRPAFMDGVLWGDFTCIYIYIYIYIYICIMYIYISIYLYNV